MNAIKEAKSESDRATMGTTIDPVAVARKLYGGNTPPYLKKAAAGLTVTRLVSCLCATGPNLDMAAFRRKIVSRYNSIQTLLYKLDPEGRLKFSVSELAALLEPLQLTTAEVTKLLQIFAPESLIKPTQQDTEAAMFQTDSCKQVYLSINEFMLYLMLFAPQLLLMELQLKLKECNLELPELAC